MKNLKTLTLSLSLFSTVAFAQSAVKINNKSQGQEQLKKKNYNEAIKYFTSCVEENDKSGDCLVGRGKAYLGLDEIGYARANFAIALKTNPNNKEAAELLEKNPDPDVAPTLTMEGIKSTRKLSPEDKKKLDAVTKAQQEVYRAEKKIK